MGEARRRGTFEQRKAAAIKRDAEILKKSKELKSATVIEKQIITPEERMKSGQFLSAIYDTLIADSLLGFGGKRVF